MKAHEKFDKWIKKNYLTNGEVADKLNWYNSSLFISAESVRQWRSGLGNPRLKARPTIEALTHSVKAGEWA